jgi:hypothetical protein
MAVMVAMMVLKLVLVEERRKGGKKETIPGKSCKRENEIICFFFSKEGQNQAWVGKKGGEENNNTHQLVPRCEFLGRCGGRSRMNRKRFPFCGVSKCT